MQVIADQIPFGSANAVKILVQFKVSIDYFSWFYYTATEDEDRKKSTLGIYKFLPDEEELRRLDPDIFLVSKGDVDLVAAFHRDGVACTVSRLGWLSPTTTGRPKAHELQDAIL